MQKSEEIKDLAAALNKAQADMAGAVKDAKNPFFKSNYADLSSVVAAVKEPFAENGLSYTQFPIEDNGRIGVETILMHSSGQWLSNSFTVNLTKQDAQGAGSAITYCRRYALQAIAGIPSEDDDGNGASQKQPSKKEIPVGLIEVVRRNNESIKAVNNAVEIGDFTAAVQCYDEITPEDNNAMWIAPKSCKEMGIPEIYTTKARKFLTEESSKYR